MDKTLQRIETEYLSSKQTFQNWREKKQEQFKVLFEWDKTDDKVNINLFASQHKALIALSYADELVVKFDPIWLEDEDMADNREIVAKTDFNLMRLDRSNYQKQSDRITYNVAIRLLEWDKENDRPYHTILDPLSWYADPNPTWFSWNDYRWHWFETEATLEELKSYWYDTEWLDFWESTDTFEIDRMRKQYLNQEKQKDNTKNKKVVIYNHFYKDNWVRTKVVCDSWFSKIFEETVCSMKDWEKENKCPVILNFYNPKRWSAVWWESVLDLLEDKQRAESKIFNLQLKKAVREALWWDFLYDPDIIKNAQQLTSKKEWRRYIKAQAWNRWLGNAMMEIPSQRLSVDVENMRSILRREAYNATNVDQIIQWVRWDQSITARESQTIQANANLNLALNNKVDSWWEKDFWEYCFYLYDIHLKESSKKLARLTVWFWSKTVTLSKSDFIWNNDLDIRIINRSDKQAEMEKEKLSIPYYQQEANNPENHEIIRLFFRRKIARLSWMTPDEVKMITYNYVEEKAKEQVAMLSRNIDVKDIDPSEDQMTYLLIYKRAIDTDAKRKAVEKRESILEEQLKNKATWWWWWMDKMLNNQMMANSMSKQREQWTVSTQDIANI